ncbi:hypothetical protein OROGR_007597 [Orobanche gracilis]
MAKNSQVSCELHKKLETAAESCYPLLNILRRMRHKEILGTWTLVQCNPSRSHLTSLGLVPCIIISPRFSRTEFSFCLFIILSEGVIQCLRLGGVHFLVHLFLSTNHLELSTEKCGGV